MTDLTATFEVAGKVAGDTISTGDAGALTPWDDIAVGGGNNLYASGAAHGSLCAKIAPAGLLRWEESPRFGGAGPSDHYGRVYFKGVTIANIQTFAPVRFLCVGVTGGGNSYLGIYFGSDGKLRVYSVTDSLIATSTGSWSLSAWHRIEYHVVNNVSAGALTIRIYDSLDDTSIAETMSLSSIDSGGRTAYWQMGFPSFNGGDEGYLDDIVANATTWPGPAFIPSVGSVFSKRDLGRVRRMRR
jgi:hypothetical protein